MKETLLLKSSNIIAIKDFGKDSTNFKKSLIQY